MKNAAKCAKQLNSLLKQRGAVPAPELPDTDDPIAVLVMSFLMWETTTEKALIAYKSIRAGVVDFNDLRVCMAQEVVDLIGPRYPRALDRTQRLRAVLRDVYSREHAVTLERLASLGKREVRKYLDSLEGMVPYVAARVALLSFDAHAIPVDDQLRTMLIEIDAADSSAENHELSSWLDRHIKASEGREAYFALQSWVDAGGKMSKSKKPRTTKKTSSGTTARKTTSKKKTTRKTSRA